MEKKVLALNDRGRPTTKPGTDFKSAPSFLLTIPSEKYGRNVGFLEKF
jgi:hypothetical protein